MSMQDPDQGVKMRSQRLLITIIPHTVAGEAPRGRGAGAGVRGGGGPASVYPTPHPLCCAGGDIAEWLIQKYCLSEEGKGSAPRSSRAPPPAPGRRAGALGGEHRPGSPRLSPHPHPQRPCTWAASWCSTATCTLCATPAALCSGPTTHPTGFRSGAAGSPWEPQTPQPSGRGLGETVEVVMSPPAWGHRPSPKCWTQCPV